MFPQLNKVYWDRGSNPNCWVRFHFNEKAELIVEEAHPTPTATHPEAVSYWRTRGPMADKGVCDLYDPDVNREINKSSLQFKWVKGIGLLIHELNNIGRDVYHLCRLGNKRPIQITVQEFQHDQRVPPPNLPVVAPLSPLFTNYPPAFNRDKEVPDSRLYLWDVNNQSWVKFRWGDSDQLEVETARPQSDAPTVLGVRNKTRLNFDHKDLPPEKRDVNCSWAVWNPERNRFEEYRWLQSDEIRLQPNGFSRQKQHENILYRVYRNPLLLTYERYYPQSNDWRTVPEAEYPIVWEDPTNHRGPKPLAGIMGTPPPPAPQIADGFVEDQHTLQFWDIRRDNNTVLRDENDARNDFVVPVDPNLQQLADPQKAAVVLKIKEFIGELKANTTSQRSYLDSLRNMADYKYGSNLRNLGSFIERDRECISKLLTPHGIDLMVSSPHSIMGADAHQITRAEVEFIARAAINYEIMRIEGGARPNPPFKNQPPWNATVGTYHYSQATAVIQIFANYLTTGEFDLSSFDTPEKLSQFRATVESLCARAPRSNPDTNLILFMLQNSLNNPLFDGTYRQANVLRPQLQLIVNGEHARVPTMAALRAVLNTKYQEHQRRAGLDLYVAPRLERPPQNYPKLTAIYPNDAKTDDDFKTRIHPPSSLVDELTALQAECRTDNDFILVLKSLIDSRVPIQPTSPIAYVLNLTSYKSVCKFMGPHAINSNVMPQERGKQPTITIAHIRRYYDEIIKILIWKTDNTYVLDVHLKTGAPWNCLLETSSSQANRYAMCLMETARRVNGRPDLFGSQAELLEVSEALKAFNSEALEEFGLGAGAGHQISSDVCGIWIDSIKANHSFPSISNHLRFPINDERILVRTIDNIRILIGQANSLLDTYPNLRDPRNPDSRIPLINRNTSQDDIKNALIKANSVINRYAMGVIANQLKAIEDARDNSLYTDDDIDKIMTAQGNHLAEWRLDVPARGENDHGPSTEYHTDLVLQPTGHHVYDLGSLATEYKPPANPPTSERERKYEAGRRNACLIAQDDRPLNNYFLREMLFYVRTVGDQTANRRFTITAQVGRGHWVTIGIEQVLAPAIKIELLAILNANRRATTAQLLTNPEVISRLQRLYSNTRVAFYETTGRVADLEANTANVLRPTLAAAFGAGLQNPTATIPIQQTSQALVPVEAGNDCGALAIAHKHSFLSTGQAAALPPGYNQGDLDAYGAEYHRTVGGTTGAIAGDVETRGKATLRSSRDYAQTLRSEHRQTLMRLHNESDAVWTARPSKKRSDVDDGLAPFPDVTASPKKGPLNDIKGFKAHPGKSINPLDAQNYPILRRFVMNDLMLSIQDPPHKNSPGHGAAIEVPQKGRIVIYPDGSIEIYGNDPEIMEHAARIMKELKWPTVNFVASSDTAKGNFEGACAKKDIKLEIKHIEVKREKDRDESGASQSDSHIKRPSEHNTHKLGDDAPGGRNAVPLQTRR